MPGPFACWLLLGSNLWPWLAKIVEVRDVYKRGKVIAVTGVKVLLVVKRQPS
jgi:uncharacterized membrane protein YccF (DUF307 family)